MKTILPEFDENQFITDATEVINNAQPLIHRHTDDSTFRNLYVSRLLTHKQTNHTLLHDTLYLTSAPTVLYYIIPGNPGVATAYVPWLIYLEHLLNEQNHESLIIFAGHLGHLENATVDQAFTCAQNVEHHFKQLSQLFTSNFTKQTKFYIAGHSAGAYFALNAIKGLLKSTEPLDHLFFQLSLIFYCGTLHTFGHLGQMKAMIASSDSGLKLMKKIRQTNWFKKQALTHKFRQSLVEEFSDNFMQQMCYLARDELLHLPKGPEDQIKILQDYNIPIFFLLAANDPYVPKSAQALYLQAFGSKNVLISPQWWHAFPLHHTSFIESAIATAGIIDNGELPAQFQRTHQFQAKSFKDLMFATQNIIAAVFVFIGSKFSRI